MPDINNSEDSISPADEAFDLIHDIALKVMAEDGLSPRATQALDAIVALARYKTNLLSPEEVALWKEEE